MKTINKMDIIIKGFIKTSLLDWDGKIVSTLYVPRCNMRCPFCQNGGLVLNPEQYPTVDIKQIKNFYLERKNFLDGICLTGGEPCLYDNLADFLAEFKDLGAGIKLDTNGTFPNRVKEVIDKDLVDYIAMDLKGPLDFESYEKSSKIKSKELLNRIKESVKIIMDSGVDYEFRTTVVPSLHNEEDIINIAKYIKGAKKYALQNFQSQNTLDKSFSKIEPYKKETLEKIAERLKPYVNKIEVRGK